MRAKIVICDLCQQTTKENEIIKEGDGPFIVGFMVEPKRGINGDPGGAERHICLDCINAILAYYNKNKKA